MDMRARSLPLLLGFVLGCLVGFAAAWLVLPVGTSPPPPSPAAATRAVAVRPPAPAAPTAPARRAERPAAAPAPVEREPSPPPLPSPVAPRSEAPSAAAPSERVPPPPDPGPAVEPARADPPAEEMPADDGAHGGEEYVWATDREGIRSAVRASLPAVRQCYAAWLEANPTLGGRIVVRFTIAPTTPDDDVARVQGAQVVESNMDHPLMESCVTAVLSTLTFEVPEDGVLTVTYPFGMAPAQPAERGAP